MTEDEDDLFQELLGTTRRGFDGITGPESPPALPTPVLNRDRLIRAAAADIPRYYRFSWVMPMLCIVCFVWSSRSSFQAYMLQISAALPLALIVSVSYLTFLRLIYL